MEMAIMEIDKVLKINKALEALGCKLHIHDTCGGQAFSIEELENTNIMEATVKIKTFFEEEGFETKFYDSHNFSIRNK